MLSALSVSKKYLRRKGGKDYNYAVQDVSINLEPGKIIGIIGRSGSGKTTLLNMLSGLLKPSEGSIAFKGKDLYNLSDKELSKLRNECFGVVPQGQTGIDSLTVLENILFPYILYPRESSCEKRALELMKRLGIEDLADAYPKELSGGELRRLAIARALITSPKIVFADEPTGDLDDENTKVVLEIFWETAKNGSAVLLVTHEQDALSFSDEVLRMNAGHIVR